MPKIYYDSEDSADYEECVEQTKIKKPKSITQIKKRTVTESVKKRVAGKQFFKCANKPGSNLARLENFYCPLWKISGDEKGCFNESGYEIDHITEFSLSSDDSEPNLQALCLICHSVKTKRFATVNSASKPKIKKSESKSTKSKSGSKSTKNKILANYKTYLAKLTVPTLKHLCDVIGCKKCGTKNELIDRLGSKTGTSDINLKSDINFMKERANIYLILKNVLTLVELRKICDKIDIAKSGNKDLVLSRLFYIDNTMLITPKTIPKYKSNLALI